MVTAAKDASFSGGESTAAPLVQGGSPPAAKRGTRGTTFLFTQLHSALAVFALVVVVLGIMNIRLMQEQDATYDRSVDEPTGPIDSEGINPLLLQVDESVMPPIVVRSTDQVCAMCTDGLVYVHLGRHALSTEQASAAPVNYTVAEELYVEPRTAHVFTATSGSADEVVSRCLAQLVSLGQLGVAQSGTAVLEGGRPQLTASVIVDFDSATPQTSLGVGGQCPGFLTELRSLTDTPSTAKMNVSYPRLPSWPLPYALNPALHGGTDAHGTLPPYFGTVAVRETDVDKDVRPPLSVALTEDRGAVVIRFGEDETSTHPEPFEMRCPAHFMSVFIGRFGRQHNQVQEMVHTLALTRHLNRTFVVPVLVPETYAHYIRIDAQEAYGFNALRREGGYCLLTYQEARSVLKVMEAEGTSLTLQRLNYFAHSRPSNESEAKKQSKLDWSVLPGTSNGVQRYNVDAWFEDSRARSPPVTTVKDGRSGGMFFTEAGDALTAVTFFARKEDEKYLRMGNMRHAMRVVTRLLGGAHDGVDGNGADAAAAVSQPRLAVVSSRMAFYMHPSLTEQTRLMGLLRPSEWINREADRLYNRVSARLSWTPAGVSKSTARHQPPTPFANTLTTGNYKHVIGFHVRRREGSCRNEAMNLGVAYALHSRYQLDREDPNWSGVPSTVKNMELDCAFTGPRLVELYRQYTRFMRRNMTPSSSEAAELVPTIYMAYDDQSGPINERVDHRLIRMRGSEQRKSMWGSATQFPDGFVAAYDQRITGSFDSVFSQENKRLNAKTGKVMYKSNPSDARRAALVDALYDASKRELLAMAFDYFMLTNTGVFRGGMISSVTNNVVMRRWGRGLPCHGVMGGYAQSLYTAMWFEGGNM